MIDRKRKTKEPCPGCALHRSRCICAHIPNLNLRTRVTLVVHAKELKRTTNTGSLAIKALRNSELIVRGLGPVDLKPHLLPDYRPLLFFPGDGARELTKELVAESPLPVQLIVPDGNWRQASKVAIRHPEIRDVERVMISVKNEAAHHLRAESSSYGMSTLQAIAKALAMTENGAAGEALESLYRAKLEGTLSGRGQHGLSSGLPADNCNL